MLVICKPRTGEVYRAVKWQLIYPTTSRGFFPVCDCSSLQTSQLVFSHQLLKCYAKLIRFKLLNVKLAMDRQHKMSLKRRVELHHRPRLAAEPLTVAYRTSLVNKRWNICHYTSLAMGFLASTLCGVSLSTSTAISVDRLLALLLGLRYRQVVTLRRTYIIAFGFWFLSIVVSSTFTVWNILILFWYQ
ncbi:unnamed protein product [Porites lobata]|uniref:G-protein coupled receptors family 1 profile domain-containing protein n=1 Tax=Porites lobata TaxID=104759 RepID=A0ABN8QUC4_9CNID|nr:unnamed protein product [Porites lobata]